MAVPSRRSVFLLLAAMLSLLSLGTGAWLFWLSGARHLLLVGVLMLGLTVLTWIWWRRLPADPGAPSRGA